jgi:ATPase family associated with various cellular activities (AAA)/Winged helix domain, variant
MSMPAEGWHAANQSVLVAALRPVYAALCRAAGRDEPPPAAPDPSDSPPSALGALCAMFGLTAFERDLLLLCAGVELEGRFAEACAGAHGDPRRNCATFGLALAALPGAHWSALSRERPLRHWRMVEVLAGETLVGSPLRIDERILHFLAGVECVDERLEGIVSPLPAQTARPSWLAGATASAARALGDGERVALTGGSRADREQVGIAALAAAGLQAWRLCPSDIPAPPAERELLARHWMREALLSGGGLLLQLDAAEAGEASRLAQSFILRITGAVVVDAGDAAAPVGLAAVQIELPEPSADERRQLWMASLGPMAVRMNGLLDAIADQFRLDTAAIRSAGVAMRQLADRCNAEVLQREAWKVCREHARRSMEHSARRIVPKADWENLVLPEPQMRILRQIAAHLRQRVTVHERWGFGARYSRGLGLTALFSGASGTGKTMAAEVLARTLDLDLFQVDLAGLVSKYIGETEKNLKRVFDAAEDSGAILLFDEADALFGKRSEVKDSHDRYANLEVSYLLQRMEAYRGLAILTTNMRHAIDAAFLRRLRFVIEFPFPDAAHRARIWQAVFPRETPTAGLDAARLARLAVPGGVIRNIAMHAAFLAADETSPVRMSHLLDAARTEYAKLERPLSSAESGAWE